MQEDIHVFHGMKRDSHPIKQEKQFLWDAHNIRLTTRDGDSMFSITNEKSTELLKSFSENETYIGHCVLGKYLVLFTKKGQVDTIYRIDVGNIKSSSVDQSSVIVLYEGDLGLSSEYMIQAIGDFESELVQKIYWVDGKNSPRVINIAKPELSGYNGYPSGENSYTSIYRDAPFGFVQDLDLTEEVTVNRNNSGNGTFPAGVIQYALTYYHKYGQESNIFYTTEPLYIAFNDRGGSPESNINTSFQIHIEGVQQNFQFLRIYSIIRTSIEAVPTVKRVADIEINDTVIDFIDNGTTGDIVDPTMLLYLGGKDIVAQCITSKDNTLFLGGIKYKRTEISSIQDIEQSIRNLSVLMDTRRKVIGSSSSSSSNLYKFHQL